MKQEINQSAHSQLEVKIMRKNLTKVVAVMTLAAIVAGSSSNATFKSVQDNGTLLNVAFAHHSRAYRTTVQNPTPVCYADGSCDVDGVCLFGVDCDGTVHHTTTYYSGTRHHGGHHH